MISHQDTAKVKELLLWLSEASESEITTKYSDLDKTGYGICAILQTHRGINIDSTCFVKWPEYSGVLAYPVKHPAHDQACEYEGGICYPGIAFYSFKRWNKRSQYGKARRRLAKWLAENTDSQDYSYRWKLSL